MTPLVESDGPDAIELFRADVLRGLAAPQKIVPARYFYDHHGSHLFERITNLVDYYPTRSETQLLKDHGAAIAELAKGRDVVVEFGAGSARKTPLLLNAVSAGTYIPIDVAGAFLYQSAAQLAEQFHGLLVLPVVGDFTRPIDLPIKVAGSRMLGFFPGSTIGNLAPAQAVDLLRQFAALLGPDAQMLIGIDTRKDVRLLEAAYDDPDGVTAAFNLNLVTRINRELGGTIPVNLLDHRAVWNDQLGRVEMHLCARESFEFQVAGQPFHMRAGESIHTENSYKYRPEEAHLIARASGWEPVQRWSDGDSMFALEFWQNTPHTPQP